MKLLTALPLILACAFPVAALAQWQWMDKDGHKVYSDRAPPPEIADKDILKQPAGAVRFGGANVAPPAPKDAASAPKPAGKDPVLEAKKKLSDEEEEAKRKLSGDKLARDRAQNCDRARSSLLVAKSGVRLKAANAAGELVFLSDPERVVEIDRLQGIIASDCK